MLKNIRQYENLHIAFWLIKDSCWVTSFTTLGMLMIIPTLYVAIDIAYRSRKNTADLFHNIAVCLWISANATWMTGEFFFKDTLRPYATVFFALGLIVVAVYYIVYFPKLKNEESENEAPVITSDPK